MTLVRPFGTILPAAEATMSTVPHQDQASATQNSSAIVAAIARPIGDGGVSTISSAAGRKASSSPCLSRLRRNGMTVSVRLTGRAPLANFIDTSLQPVQRRIATAGLDQRVMGAVLDQAAVLERDDAIRGPYGREPVRDDENGSSLGDLLHVVLDDPLALIIERTRRLVEDQDARIRDQCAGDGDALALAARQGRAAFADDRIVALIEFEDEFVR